MDENLVPKAIKAALNNNWEEAIRINLIILSHDQENAEALNRLAFAYLQVGQIKKAKTFYRRVVNLDPYNDIAKKNLAKIETLKGQKNILKNFPGENSTLDSAALFIEEPGKTKCINLVKIATPSILSRLRPSEEVHLILKRHSMAVTDLAGVYLGALPDDVGYKLAKRQKAGNKYVACIKFAGKNSLTIFIREIFRAKRFRDQPTFSTVGNPDYYSFVHDDTTITEYPKLIDDRPQENVDSED